MPHGSQPEVLLAFKGQLLVSGDMNVGQSIQSFSVSMD